MTTSPTGRHPVVTLAALYGAGGSLIGPKVAARLAVPLLDRTITERVAQRTGLTEDAVADIDDQPRSTLQRLMDLIDTIVQRCEQLTSAADS